MRTGKCFGPSAQDVSHIQLVSKDFPQVLSDLLLLLDATVVLYGQNHWEPEWEKNITHTHFSINYSETNGHLKHVTCVLDAAHGLK